MRLPKSTALSKLNLFLACIAMILYIVGFACPYWLAKDFIMPNAATGLGFDLSVEATMGLYTACQLLKYPNGSEDEDCSSDGADDWQKISIGLAIPGAVLGLIAVILAALGVVHSKVANCCRVKIVITCFECVASGTWITALILHAINRKIQVKPPSPFQVDFDLGWAYFVSAVGAGLFAILVLLNVIDIIWSHSNGVSSEKD